MRTLWTLSLMGITLLMGLGCAGSMSTMAKPDEGTAAARDTSTTTTARDTSAVENPPGYRGMERDTTAIPPIDTSGMKAVDSTPADTTRSAR